MKHINVVAAIIEYNNKILCMQRNRAKYDYISYKYEFPGGKIEPNESLENAILRELKEEMDYSVTITKPFKTITHSYPDFSITMHTFLCKASSPNFNMKEHIAFKWLEPQNMLELDWAQADYPIVKELIEYYKNRE
jgi:ADP-ribose pyrophosphatase